MTAFSNHSSEELWARFRFSVIGPLLSAPPPPGQLCPAIRKLAGVEWVHPIEPERRLKLGFSTIERWYYAARELRDPLATLRRKTRCDAGSWRKFNDDLQAAIKRQYEDDSSWSMLLHYENLSALVRQKPKLGPLPSYSAFTRYMHARGYIRKPRRGNRPRPGQEIAQERLASHEVRSYEVDYVGGLWHLDFHKSKKISILLPDGSWVKPMLLAVMDDRSRICCHAQFYLDETTETLCHGFFQALLKFDLPRRLMTDNGSAMISAEFIEGLDRCTILHDRTLAYSPHQNGKQETFWALVEGSMLAMLDRVTDLDLARLNEITQAWVNQYYQHRQHQEINTKPITRYLEDKNVLRPAPTPEQLADRFRRRVWRRARRSDGTFTLHEIRFEIPSAFRHLRRIRLAYAKWNLGFVHLVDERDGTALRRVYPVDKSLNAQGERRRLEDISGAPTAAAEPVSKELPPLLRELLAKQDATGLPPAYIPKDEIEKDQENN